MMKWKVVRNPRSASADGRTLESCLKNDAQNTEEETEQEPASPVKDTNQRDSSLVRKPSVVATDCINLKSFLGLKRQRSETNLNSLGLLGTEPRRSRSEVRGISCDRLTIGYHTAPSIPLESGKTRSSSPPSKPAGGWLRGRKRERESRNPVKNNRENFGKTVVAGSNGKRTKSTPRNADYRTISDSSSEKEKSRSRLSLNSDLTISGKEKKKTIVEEEVIYSEIKQEKANSKLLEDDKETSEPVAAVRDPNKVIRKKGLAPKPQITTEHFKDSEKNGNLKKSVKSSNSSRENTLNTKCLKKSQLNKNTHNQITNKNENVKLNNIKNSEKSIFKTKQINNNSSVVSAEIHHVSKSNPSVNSDCLNSLDRIALKTDKLLNNKTLFNDKEQENNCLMCTEDTPPFHIDTPDYSTLNSVKSIDCSITDDITNTKENISDTNYSEKNREQTSLSSVDDSCSRVVSLSSILRDTSNEAKESEPKKTVRFEKLDLIEKYKKHKSEILTEDEMSVTSESKSESLLDINSNEIVPGEDIFTETSEMEQECDIAESESNSLKGMSVNVIVRSPSPSSKRYFETHKEKSNEFVVKKSFVLTVAKQEKGFQSLCANKKSEPLQRGKEQQISVTFLCSESSSDGWINKSKNENDRLRSTSVPPPNAHTIVESLLTPVRGQSKERRSKERQHSKRNHHKSKKKDHDIVTIRVSAADPVFVMPQAVIDELSLVLEKRKPSLDESPLHP